jgi:acetoin utilization deacetylase AcuC-like enzyme
VYEQIVWPVARRFKPELIIVSSGFDAHWADPLGKIQLSIQGYDYLNRELLKMADELTGGKIVFVLEGGYNLESLSHGVLNVASVLLGDSQIVDPLGEAKSREAEIGNLIKQIKTTHSL